MPVLLNSHSIAITAPVVGLTGGIASGKSTVAKLLTQAGADHIDCDQIARKVVAPGRPELELIARQFGANMLNRNGELNRRAMRERVFQSSDDRQRLEDILHPSIRVEIEKALTSPATGRYHLLDAPLLLEMKLHQYVQRVCVVDVMESTQIQRLIVRDGIDQQLAENMLAAQMSRTERLNLATDIIDNNGSMDALAEQVSKLHAKFSKLRLKTV